MKKKWLVILVTICLVFASLAGTVLGGDWTYNLNPDYVRGKYYLYDSSGKRVNKTGWVSAYSYAEHLEKGETFKSTTVWYYLNSDHSVYTGWKKIGGKWYYFQDKNKQYGVQGDRPGLMSTGIIKVKSKWYILTDSGMKTGWYKNYDGKWYFASKSGAVYLKGWHTIGGKKYYFSPMYGYKGWPGYMRTGWVKLKGKWYYFGSNGAMRTGWQKVSGKWYYLNKKGVMLTGRQKIGGKTYVFNKKGVWIR